MNTNEFVLEKGLKVEVDSLCCFSFEGLKETLRFLHKKQAIQNNQISLLAKQLNIDLYFNIEKSPNFQYRIQL